MKTITSLVVCCVCSLSLTICLGQSKEGNGWIELIDGEGLTLFQEPYGEWIQVGSAELDTSESTSLVFEEGSGVITNGNPGKTKHLLSMMKHGDIEFYVEFMIPEKANSGIYFMGRYEVQILDSYGVETLRHYHCGGIYERHKWPENYGFEGTAPRLNAARRAGEWQSYEIIFRAPRFADNGDKIENARFIRVVHNGKDIHDNQEVTGPTRAAAFGDETPLGPLMIQGDHGSVALQNSRVRHLDSID